MSKTEYDCLLELLHFIRPCATVGFMPDPSGGSAPPDFLLLLAKAIMDKKPHHIVDLGSGATTLVAGYCLKQLGGNGHITAFEHDNRFATNTHTLAQQHGLLDYVSVVLAPLSNQRLEGLDFEWYGMKEVISGMLAPDSGNAEEIDMLVVDGPPGWTCPLARFPAMHRLRPMLADGAVVFVDDAARQDEAEMVRRWCRANPDGVFAVEYLNLRRGAYRLHWQKNNKGTGTS